MTKNKRQPIIGEWEYDLTYVCDFCGENHNVVHRTLEQSPKLNEKGIIVQIGVK